MVSYIACGCMQLLIEILWPGNQDYALRYREKLYYFSSEEAKEKFAENPTTYIAQGRPLKVFMEYIMKTFIYIFGSRQYFGCCCWALKHQARLHLGEILPNN